MRWRSARLCFAAALAIARPLSAQQPVPGNLSIAGVVVGSNGAPLPFSTASIRETGAERFSDERGAFVLANLAPGSYHLRIKQLGFAAVDTVVVLRADAVTPPLRVVLSPVAFRLSTVTVRSTRACITPAEAAEATTDFQTILAELRKNADRERLLVTSYPFVYRILRTLDQFDAPGARRTTDTLSYRSDERGRYSPGNLVRTDSTVGDMNKMMVVPVLEDLGDPEFLRSHCFTYAGTERDRSALWHRIDFKPNRIVHTADVEGSVFLDTASFVVRRAIFRLTRPEQVNMSLRELHVTTNYREVLPGVTVIGDIVSVQLVRGPYIASRTLRLTEKQRLLDYRFVRGQPGDTGPGR